MNLRLIVAMGFFAIALAGCGEQPPLAPSASKAPGSLQKGNAKIWVSKSGAIELNGKEVEIEAVSAALSDLEKRGGVVLYGRDAPEGEPHPNSMKIMELVVANRLPIRMSMKRDFSDAIGTDGKTKE